MRQPVLVESAMAANTIQQIFRIARPP